MSSEKHADYRGYNHEVQETQKGHGHSHDSHGHSHDSHGHSHDSHDDDHDSHEDHGHSHGGPSYESPGGHGHSHGGHIERPAVVSQNQIMHGELLLINYLNN